MSERLQYEGRLAETSLKAKEVRLRLEGLRDSLRLALDQFEPLENLEGEKVAALALEFRGLQIQYLELLAQERAICKALGR